MKKTFSINGMGCEHCVQSVTKAVSALAGVKSVQVSLENKNMVCEYEGISDVEIIKAVRKAGFSAKAV